MYIIQDSLEAEKNDKREMAKRKEPDDWKKMSEITFLNEIIYHIKEWTFILREINVVSFGINLMAPKCVCCRMLKRVWKIVCVNFGRTYFSLGFSRYGVCPWEDKYKVNFFKSSFFIIEFCLLFSRANTCKW